MNSKELTQQRGNPVHEHSTNQSRAIEATLEKEYLETQLDNLVQQKIDLSDQLRQQCASEGIPLQSVKNPELLLPMKWRSVQWLVRLLIGTGTRLGVGIGLRWPRYHRAKVLGKKLRLECWRELQCSLAKSGGLAMSSVQDSGSYLCGDISLANVPDDRQPLASGVLPAREAGSAGSMTEVPEGRLFGPSVCSISSSLSIREIKFYKKDDGKVYYIDPDSGEETWSPCGIGEPPQP